MMHIILNTAEFDREWAYETMASILSAEMRVVIIPLSENSGWSDETVYYQDMIRSKGDYAKKLILPFRHYGIPRRNITVLEHYDEDPDTAAAKIIGADLVLLTGGDPYSCLHAMEDMGLDRILDNYHGILMSCGAAASALSETFISGEYEEHGLGILPGFDLDAQYEEDAEHVGALIRTLENHLRQILIIPPEGGVLIDENECALFGEAFIADANDLEELYLLEESLL